MDTRGEKLRAASNHTGSCFYFKPGILKPNARYKLAEVEETEEAYIFTLDVATSGGCAPVKRVRPDGSHQCDNLQYIRSSNPSFKARFGASPALFTGNKVTVLKKAARFINLRTQRAEQATKQQKEFHLKPSRFKPVDPIPVVPNGFIDSADLGALVRAINTQKETNPELSLEIREDGRLRITMVY
jgi:hypothetical protein